MSSGYRYRKSKIYFNFIYSSSSILLIYLYLHKFNNILTYEFIERPIDAFSTQDTLNDNGVKRPMT